MRKTDKEMEISSLRAATGRFKRLKLSVRFGKTKDALRVRKHVASVTDNKRGTIIEPPKMSIGFYLLISKKYENQVNYIYDNIELIESIIGKSLDVCLIGYNKDKEFKQKDFGKFIGNARDKSNWKWKDMPQLFIAKLRLNGKFYEIDYRKSITIYYEEWIKLGYSESLSEILNDMVMLGNKSSSIDEFFKKIWKKNKWLQIREKVTKGAKFLISKGDQLITQYVSDEISTK